MAAVGGPQLQALLGLIGAPVNPQSMRALGAWQQAEGGSAANNPFNTTENAPGATNYNSVGVKSYMNTQQGLKATADTLLNGRYGQLVGDLRGGHSSAMKIAQDIAASPWGTGSLVEKVLGGGGGATAPLKPVGAQAGGQSAGASMPNGVLQLLMQNNADIAGGKTPDPTNMLSILQQLQSAKAGTGAASAGSGAMNAGEQLLSGPGGTGKAAQVAKQYLGVPYVWGGSNPKTGLDCSGFLQNVMKDQGINIARTTYDQFKQGTPVNINQIKSGDAVFTHPEKDGPGHVGLYIGNGQVQESPHTGESNKIIPLSEFLSGGLVGVRRY